ncbi:hypothetical protein P171DRAFT_194005 [Karstenula rhodostoma CBS 690.94]|uniref:Uncharacterized protein n=1 Tax=Karstenula rhodostoma CBS 690.94 TaxID=1392251 RepID=A0A9P4UF04_9PLEO|nr:hypothetical protein P171DRAFT_194005 [Karstenula rhodostoma CBS 690.94]
MANVALPRRAAAAAAAHGCSTRAHRKSAAVTTEFDVAMQMQMQMHSYQRRVLPSTVALAAKGSGESVAIAITPLNLVETVALSELSHQQPPRPSIDSCLASAQRWQ